MSDIITERSAGILRIQLNRPAKKNALTSSMYLTLADLLNKAAKDDQIRVVLCHGAGDSFCAGNDLEELAKNPPGLGEGPQGRFMDALLDFDKPIVAAVHGLVSGVGSTMLTHCDLVYAGESAKFQMPFIHFGLVPDFGSTCSVPALVGHVRAAELFFLGEPFEAKRAGELGLVTRVIPDEMLLTAATETAQNLAKKPADALQACKRLMKWSTRQQVEDAMRAENDEFASRVRSGEAREAMKAALEKHQPDLTRTAETIRTEKVS